jgi:biopolymer transport protein ExbD
MAFGSFDSGAGRAQTMSEINMIPLIDVMLVLLVIFIITAPLLTHAVKLDLPKASSTVNLTQPDNIQLAIDGASRFHWNGEVLDRAEVKVRLAAAGKLEPQPELHLRADKTTPYEAVAQVLSDSAAAGLTRIGFVTDPTVASAP